LTGHNCECLACAKASARHSTLLDNTFKTGVSLPSVFRFSNAGGVFSFYVGELSTLEGLALFEPDEPVQILEFYTGGSSAGIESAIGMGRFPNAITSVRMATSYFRSNPSVDLVDFAARIGENVKLSTHDDGECSFVFDNMDAATELMKRCPGLKDRPDLVQFLFENAGRYVSVTPQGETATFPDFDSYVTSISE